jgi:hypothetical protein
MSLAWTPLVSLIIKFIPVWLLGAGAATYSCSTMLNTVVFVPVDNTPYGFGRYGLKYEWNLGVCKL